jgi:hypothetical protein
MVEPVHTDRRAFAGRVDADWLQAAIEHVHDRR